MDDRKFFDELKRYGNGIFIGPMSQSQVDGVNAIVEECVALQVPLEKAAYILATAYGETGGKMQPQYENMKYSAKRIPQVFNAARRQGVPIAKLAYNPEMLANTVYGGAWGSARLGNTERGDGWRFRGAGMGQITGRYNFTKWSEKMGMDFLRYPEKLMDLKTSVKALVRPMIEGWATGLRLDTFINSTKKDYFGARQVWNGVFEAAKYARYAASFEAALIAGGYDHKSQPVRPVARDKPSATKIGNSGWFFNLIMRLFGK